MHGRVIDVAGTSTYKLNSKKCWSNSRQYVWGMHTNYSGLAQHGTYIEGSRPPTNEARVMSHVNRRGVQSCDCQLTEGTVLTVS